MTDKDNTIYPKITWELNEIISNLQTMMNLHCLESTSENDAEAVAEMTALYGDVLIEEFKKVADKVEKLEDFYNDFNKGLDGNITT